MSIFEQLGTYLADGGFVMPPLVLAAAFLWYGLGYRMLTLRRGTSLDLLPLLEEVRQWPKYPCNGVIDRAAVLGCAVAKRRPPNLRAALDDAFTDLEKELRQFAVLVKAIVVAAPLAGLLGTVAGMIETFDALAEMALFTHSGGVAAGVSQALVSTQTGLAVAIPGLLIGRVLTRRESVLQMELTKLKHHLCIQVERREVGAG